MDNSKSPFGIVGLGRMGGNLALQALEKGFRVVGYTRGGASDDLRAAGLTEIATLADFVPQLPPPRPIFLYVPAGPIVDTLLEELSQSLTPGDILIDGGNSYWGDSIRRQRRLLQRGLAFVDLGTSGGIDGARHGACFMAGGERTAVAPLEPILTALAVPNGYVHAGPPGAGHFTKLVHNGIEFGMLQAIAEGVDLLAHYRDSLDIPAILGCWRHGSVIRSWLIDLLHAAAAAPDNPLDRTPPYVDDTGEVNWLVDDALHMDVPTPVIAQAVVQLMTSRDERHIAARAIALMRHGFGGHPFGPDAAVRREREEGRIHGFLRK